MDPSDLPARPAPAELARILARRGNDRLDAILATDDPFAVVAAMPPAELFFTYAEQDEELNRRIVVRLATAAQLEYLLDLDLWEGDEIDPARALDWIERLLGSSDDGAMTWAIGAASELMVSVLHSLVDVYEGPEASQMALTEAQDQLPPFTVEGHYFIHFRSKAGSQEIKQLLTLMAGEDIEYYLALMLDVIVVPRAESMEEALRQRWARLSDEGIEPPDVAYDIYRWPSDEELAATDVDGSTGPAKVVDESLVGAPTALALGQPPGLLAAALGALPSAAALDRVTRSIAATSNLVLSADHLPLSDLEAHGRALSKTLGYVAIGLGSAAGDDPARAAELLASTSARMLFRRGYREVAALGRRATTLRRQGWLSQVGLGLEVLDSPIGETVAALARPRPLFTAALSGEAADREFRDLAEVARSRSVLDRAEALGVLFNEGLGLNLAPAAAFDLDSCHPPTAAELTLGLILRTAVARLALDDQMRFEPVEARRLSELPGALLEGKALSTDLRDRALDTLRSRLDDTDEATAAHVTTFLDECLDILAAAFEGLEPGQPVDPRFVGAIVVRDPR